MGYTYSPIEIDRINKKLLNEYPDFNEKCKKIQFAALLHQAESDIDIKSNLYKIDFNTPPFPLRYLRKGDIFVTLPLESISIQIMKACKVIKNDKCNSYSVNCIHIKDALLFIPNEFKEEDLGPDSFIIYEDIENKN